MVGQTPRVLEVHSPSQVLSLPYGKLITGMFKANMDGDCSGITPEDSSHSTYHKAL